MSGYENVVGGKLKLKGKALDVKAGGLKKKKKQKKHYDQTSQVTGNELPTGWLIFSYQNEEKNLFHIDLEKRKFIFHHRYERNSIQFPG